jgi:hypothetical protein
MGSYVDTCVKVAGQWRIKEKLIDPWNSVTAPMAGHLITHAVNTLDGPEDQR